MPVPPVARHPHGAAPDLVVRVAALPVGALEDLRFEKTWAGMLQVQELTRLLGERGSLLSDALFEVIGDCDPALKPHVVALRRAVYAVRLPRERIWNDQVRAALPDGLVADLRRWCTRWADRERLIGELPARHAEELRSGRAALRAAVARPEFRYGLVQGSPALFEELSKWLAAGPEAVLDRQSTLRLVKYLARVVAKTSPYSTFTISGVQPWQPAGPVPGPGTTGAVQGLGGWRWRSALEINAVVVARILARLRALPELSDRWPLRVNPSVVRDGDSLRFLSRAAGGPIAGVRISEAVTICLELVEDGTAGTVPALRAALAAVDPELEPAAVSGFVDKLVDAGLIEQVPPIPDQCDDHLVELARELERTAHPEAATLAASLRGLRELVVRYADLDDPAERPPAHRQIRAAVRDVLADPGPVDAAGRAPLPEKNLFHENAVFTRPALSCDPQAWQPVIDDLVRLRPVLACLAPNLAGKHATAAFFARRFGPAARMPWLIFHQELNRFLTAGPQARLGDLDGLTLRAICAGPVFMPVRQWRELPFAAEVTALTNALTAAVRAVEPDVHGVLRVDLQVLETIVKGWPGDLPTPDSIACYLQPVDATGSEVVLNAVTVGHGRGRTRLSRLAGLVTPDRLREVDPSGPGPREGWIDVECGAMFGSNLNLRRPGVSHELDVPFGRSDRPAGRRIALRDLDVVHDPDAGALRLVHAGTGARVNVVHTGMMGEFFLPPAIRSLVDVFGPAPTLLHAGYPLFLPPERDPRAGGVGRLARVAAGQVVLARACWAFRSGEFPLRRPGENDLTWWQRVIGWTSEHGVPSRCYARVMGADDTTGAAALLDLKSRKPLYVDFANWHLVALLERAIGTDDQLIVISEALPDLADAPRYGDARHVTEMIVEVNGD